IQIAQPKTCLLPSLLLLVLTSTLKPSQAKLQLRRLCCSRANPRDDPAHSRKQVRLQDWRETRQRCLWPGKCIPWRMMLTCWAIADRSLFAQVFRAANDSLGKPECAVKVVDTTKMDEEMKKIFLPRELSALIEIKHRFIVHVFDIFRHR